MHTLYSRNSENTQLNSDLNKIYHSSIINRLLYEKNTNSRVCYSGVFPGAFIYYFILILSFLRSTSFKKRQPINILYRTKKTNLLTFLKNISDDWLNDWKDSGILGLEMEKPIVFCVVKFFGFIIIRKNVVANVAKWLVENVARNIRCRHIHLKVGLPPVIRFVILHFKKKPETSWKKG